MANTAEVITNMYVRHYREWVRGPEDPEGHIISSLQTPKGLRESADAITPTEAVQNFMLLMSAFVTEGNISVGIIWEAPEYLQKLVEEAIEEEAHGGGGERVIVEYRRVPKRSQKRIIAGLERRGIQARTFQPTPTPASS